MGIRVDKHSGVPVYIQIMNQIKKEIILGRIKEGDKLPPTRDLAKMLNVNINTVLKAYERLQFEGVIEARHGVGYFVSQKSFISNKVLEEIKILAKILKEEGVDLLIATTILEEVYKYDKNS